MDASIWHPIAQDVNRVDSNNERVVNFSFFKHSNLVTCVRRGRENVRVLDPLTIVPWDLRNFVELYFEEVVVITACHFFVVLVRDRSGIRFIFPNFMSRLRYVVGASYRVPVRAARWAFVVVCR